MPNAVVRLTVNLSPAAADKLAWLADQWKVNRTEALHRSIFSSAVLQEKSNAGSQLLLRSSSDGKLQALELTGMS